MLVPAVFGYLELLDYPLQRKQIRQKIHRGTYQQLPGFQVKQTNRTQPRQLRNLSSSN